RPPRSPLFPYTTLFRSTDSSVATHAKIADIVKKDHAGRGLRINRFAEDRSDDRVMAAWVADAARTARIVFAAKTFYPLSHRSVAELRKPRDTHTRRLPAGMRIDRRDPLRF